MMKVPVLSIKVIGWVAAGAALYGGWKLGEYLGDVALGKRELNLPDPSKIIEKIKFKEPLWKRQFSPVSEEA